MTINMYCRWVELGGQMELGEECDMSWNYQEEFQGRGGWDLSSSLGKTRFGEGEAL